MHALALPCLQLRAGAVGIYLVLRAGFTCTVAKPSL